LLDIEVAQALRRHVRVNKVSEERGEEAVMDLASLRLVRYPHYPHLERIWDLRQNLTAYDAAYVALDLTNIAQTNVANTFAADQLFLGNISIGVPPPPAPSGPGDAPRPTFATGSMGLELRNAVGGGNELAIIAGTSGNPTAPTGAAISDTGVGAFNGLVVNISAPIGSPGNLGIVFNTTMGPVGQISGGFDPGVGSNVIEVKPYGLPGPGVKVNALGESGWPRRRRGRWTKPRLQMLVHWDAWQLRTAPCFTACLSTLARSHVSGRFRS
jgi:hypothetical protein